MDTAGTGDASTMVVCATGRSICDGSCVDTARDPAHCGTCGHGCADAEHCVDGECSVVCPAAQAFCAGTCRDIAIDPKHCGGCDKACNPSEVCVAGQCAVSCGNELVSCDGTCRDISVDPKNCGKCNNACAAGEVCSAGICLVSCSTGLTNCDGTCRDISIDPKNCGKCNNACATSEACSAGICLVSCSTGLTNCDGTCRDISTDPKNCGKCNNACATNEVCSAGICLVSCSTGLTNCDGTCRDISIDPKNCGKCNNACATSEVCSAGQCVVLCGSGLANCNGTCRDVAVDSLNCGSCGKSCEDGTNCVAGKCQQCSSSLWFSGSPAYPGNGPSEDVALVDLNQDGRLDIVVAGYIYPGQVLINQGNGLFQPMQKLDAANDTYGFKVVDLNGDKLKDLIAFNYWNSSVVTFLNQGDGTLSSKTFSLPANLHYPFSMAVADFDGDGDLDVVTSNQEKASLTLLRGDGTGNFSDMSEQSLSSDSYSIAAGDLDGDQDIDLVRAAYYGNDLEVLTNDGKGAFSVTGSWPAGVHARAPALADLDGDGLLDVVLTTQVDVGGQLVIMRGEGDGTFFDSKTIATSTALACIISDMTEDGRPDLVCSGQGLVAVFRNQGTSFAPEEDYPAGGTAGTIACGDLNADGFIDVAFAQGSGTSQGGSLGGALVLYGKRDATLQAPVALGLAGEDASSMLADDMDGDGSNELIITMRDTGTIAAYRPGPGGTIEPITSVAAGTLPEHLLALRLNDDPLPDFVVSNQGKAQLSLFISQSSGQFGPQTVLSLSQDAIGLTAGDINGDKHLDIAALLADGVSVQLLLGDGTGMFDVLAPVTRDTNGDNLEGILMGDVRQNGSPELFLWGYMGTVYVAQWDQTSVLKLNRSVDIPGSIHAGLLVDVNRDRRLDLMLGMSFPNSLYTLPSASPPMVSTGAFAAPNTLMAADMNADGAMDIVATSNAGSAMVFLGKGDGTFAPEIHFATPVAGRAIAAIDWNYDGRLDLAVLTSNALTILENQSSVCGYQ